MLSVTQLYVIELLSPVACTLKIENIILENDASRVINYALRVMLQAVASL
jgi:hypothetical protein